MLKSSGKELGVALRITLLIALLGGLIYPVAMTGVAQVLFKDKANGGLITDSSGSIVGTDHQPYVLGWLSP